MRIKSHAPIVYVGTTFAGVFTLAFMSFYVHGMRQRGRDSWFLYAFVSPFVAMGTFLLLVGGRFLVRLARFGSWQLDIPEGGGRFGQPLEATLIPSRTRVATGELTCHLRCVRIIRTTGTNTRTETTTLWDTTWTTRAGTIHPKIGLPLTLPLPAAGQPTNIDSRTASGIQWQLNVVVPTRHGGDEPVFDVPVRT